MRTDFRFSNIKVLSNLDKKRVGGVMRGRSLIRMFWRQ